VERRQLVRFLQHVPLFRGLQADEIDVVAGAARVRDVERGRFFFRPGAPAEVAYVLYRGRVKLTQSTGDGASVVVRFVGPGDLFGIETLLDRRLYRLAASAVRPARALAWKAATMTGLMERYPRIALNTLRELSGRMQELRERYLELATEPVEQRIAHTVLRLSAQVGSQTTNGLLIDMPLSRADLGAMTGATLYTVSRVLRGWHKRGFVEVGRQRVAILQPDAIRSIAGVRGDRTAPTAPRSRARSVR
jgi:CRP-like cAMP-binding protein